MIIEILFKNDDDNVLLRGGSVTGDLKIAQIELEDMFTYYMKKTKTGEICEGCENTGWRTEQDGPDDSRKVECGCQNLTDTDDDS